MQKIQKIPVDLLGIQPFGRPAIELREFAHLQDIGLDGFGRAIAQLQIFNETLPQRSHESIPNKEENRRCVETSCGKYGTRLARAQIVTIVTTGTGGKG
jgi:hypothetical protein